MSKATTKAPRPVPAFYTNQLFPGPLAEAAIDQEDTQLWSGWCAPFCDVGGPEVSEIPITKHTHGTFCQSRTVGAADGLDRDNVPDTVYLDLDQHYTHGVYPIPSPRKNPYVRLFLDSLTDDGQDDSGIFLDSGQVRVLAAQLVAAADILDRIGTPVGKEAGR